MDMQINRVPSQNLAQSAPASNSSLSCTPVTRAAANCAFGTLGAVFSLVGIGLNTSMVFIGDAEDRYHHGTIACLIIPIFLFNVGYVIYHTQKLKTALNNQNRPPIQEVDESLEMSNLEAVQNRA